MDFRPTEDQIALRDGIRSFLDGQLPFDRIPELEKAGGVDRGLWNELAEMGVFALRLPEEEGGVGLGYADAVLVFAELGRRLVPGPVVWSHLAAGLVDGAASGETIVGGLDRLGALPGLAASPAIARGRVLAVDDLALLGFGPGLVDALEALAKETP